MPDIYNETSMANGPVPKTGNTDGSAPAGPSASNSNPATSQADGTASPRADTQTFQATPNTTPSGGKTSWPDIQSYNGESV